MPAAAEQPKSRRLEMILEQIDALPTLPSVASRLLRLSSAADADFKQIISMIESDPALTARILGLCRKVDRGATEEISTVERAVVFLGFEAVRAAALSVNVYDVFSVAPDQNDDAAERSGSTLNRSAFWRFSIATACAAEALAQEHRTEPGVPKPAEAFVCGLLHGVGILALEYALPRSYGRVLEIAAKGSGSLSVVERGVLGIDHHATGRRLAERWGLPRMLHDVMWLSGLPYEALPDVPHRKAIGLVNVSAALARKLHLGWSGDPGAAQNPTALSTLCGLDPRRLAAVEKTLHERVAERAKLLGMDDLRSGELLLESIGQANRELERLRSAAADRAALAEQHAQALGEIAAIHRERQAGGVAPWGLPMACASVARSVAKTFKADFCTIVIDDGQGPWESRRFVAEGAGMRALPVVDLSPPQDQPEGGPRTLREILTACGENGVAGGPAPWLPKAVGAGQRLLRAITLDTDLGAACVLLYTPTSATPALASATVSALAGCWGGLIAEARRVEEINTYQEQLADIARQMAEAQAGLHEVERLRRIAHIAAGTVAEMRRPVDVIRGRLEPFMGKQGSQRENRALEAIDHANQRIDKIMDTLRLVVDPPTPKPEPVNIAQVLHLASREARQRVGPDHRRLVQPVVKVLAPENLPRPLIDHEQVLRACIELVVNALEAPDINTVELRAQMAPQGDRLIVTVTDDGPGMPPDLLERAFEPFAFQRKSTPRKGLGLTTAKALLGLNGGDIALRSELGSGLTATITLRLEAPAAPEMRAA